MPFTPTTWANGVAPGISAAELQRLEVGVSELWAQQRDLRTETASHILALTDAGKIVEMNSASALTVTVPPNSDVAFPVGTQLELVRLGAGSVTVVAGSGVTVRTPSTLQLAARYSGATLYKRATNEWVLNGDLLAA